MSKSLNNHLLIRDALKRWPAESIRYNFLTHHYSSNVDFSEEAFKVSVRRLHYYYATLAALDHFADKTPPAEKPEKNYNWETVFESFHHHMCDDFNYAAVIGHLNATFRQAHEIIKGGAKMRPLGARWAATIREVGAVLGLFKADPPTFLTTLRDQLIKDMPITVSEIEAAIQNRNEARTRKDFKASDEIRNSLAQRGIELMDGKDGTNWGIKLTPEAL